MPCPRRAIAGWRHPGEVGREGVWLLLCNVYTAVFPAAHPCRNGPKHGKCVREIHRHSPQPDSQRPHLHLAAEFVADHKWKAVERCLREQQGVKVQSNSSAAARGSWGLGGWVGWPAGLAVAGARAGLGWPGWAAALVCT